MSKYSPIRVLIVDDSALTRRILREAISAEPDLEVVGTAPDGIIALEKIRMLQPDVLTVDLAMQKMDGITLLRQLTDSPKPVPAVVISSLAQGGNRPAIQALEAGAVEVLAKPAGFPFAPGFCTVLGEKIRAAALTHNTPRRSGSESPQHSRLAGVSSLVAIGASTGGAEAIRQVLQDLPVHCPPIVIVQHMPAVFSKAFAARLDQLCPMRVKEAEHMESIEPGTVLIAPGNYHMTVASSSRGLHIRLRQGELVCYQRPSVDVLFESVADVCGFHALGVILTGMGDDGASGLLRLREAGARTIAQDEATCTVYGMPRQAVLRGGVERTWPLSQIGRAICSLTGLSEATSADLSH